MNGNDKLQNSKGVYCMSLATNKAVLITVIAVLIVSCSTSKVNPHYRSLSKFKANKEAPMGSDTANYLQHNFAKHKEKYIGKKFSTIIDDLKLNVCEGISTPDNGLPYSKNISLYFLPLRIDNEKTGVRYSLGVDFQEKLNVDEMDSIRNKHNRLWSNEQYEYLKDKIVENIVVGDSRKWRPRFRTPNPKYKALSEFITNALAPTCNDTVKYLQYNFIDNKEEYVGKTFSDFISDLKTGRDKQLIMYPPKKEKQYTNYIRICLVPPIPIIRPVPSNEVAEQRTVLRIKFQKKFNYNELYDIQKQTESRWSNRHYDYLREMVIKDIILEKVRK